MLKIWTVVFFSFILSASCFAMGDKDSFNQHLSVKNIIKAKLWYEGIKMPERAEFKPSEVQAPRIAMPEELAVALDKLES